MYRLLYGFFDGSFNGSFDRMWVVWYKYLRLLLWLCGRLQRYVAATYIDYCRAFLMALLMALLTEYGFYGTNTCGCCCGFVQGFSDMLLQHV